MDLLVAELLLKNQRLRFALNDARELIGCFRSEVVSLFAENSIPDTATSLEQTLRFLFLLTDRLEV